MRVVIVTAWWPNDDQPGLGSFNVAHAKAIARHHDVHVVWAQPKVGPRQDTTDPSGLPLTTITVTAKAPVATLRGLNELRKLVNGADIVHSMAYGAVNVLAPLYPLIRKRWVHSEHWGVFLSGRMPIPWRVRRSMRLPRKVSTVSHALREAVSPLTRERAATVIPNIVADDFQACDQPAWEPLKLVAVGNLVESKRPLLAVDAVAALTRANEDVTLTWIGDGPLRAAVLDRASEHGVADRVMLPGWAPLPEVAEFMAAANVFFLPTEWETFLVSAVEALAVGRPVVLPRLPSLDYVTDDNGVLVDEVSAESFAAAIVEVRKLYRDRSADSVSSTVLPRFTAARVGDQFDRFYAGLGV